MAVWKRIRNLSFKQLFLLARTFIKQPPYFFPTHRATLTTVRVCDRLFGMKHHQNNAANAFRHALWNVLIAKACFEKNSSIAKSVEWTKTVTDLHEKLAPNDKLEMTMDLHNNKIGRNLFAEKQLQLKDEAGIIAVLKEKMETAVEVGSILEIRNAKNEFVYIKDRKTR